MVPEDVRYTAEHEWVQATGTGTVRVGITHFAQDALGDIVYVSLPAVGSQLTAGAACGEVESTKSVSDIYAPDGEQRPVRRRLDARAAPRRRHGGRRAADPGRVPGDRRAGLIWS